MLTLRPKIKALRLANKLTQVEAARILGMAGTSYGDMERGRGVFESKKIKEVYDKLKSLLDASNLHDQSITKPKAYHSHINDDISV